MDSVRILKSPYTHRCNVFKAASTSWMYNFNLLAGYSPQFLRKSNIVALELARKRYGRVSVKEVRRFIVFAVNIDGKHTSFKVLKSNEINYHCAFHMKHHVRT